MKLTVLLAPGRPVLACLALIGMLFLASCQSQPEVKPMMKMASDSTANGLLESDPPVKPSGPGGGP